MKALKDIQGPQVSQPNLRNISNSPNSEGRDLSGILVSMRAEVDPRERLLSAAKIIEEERIDAVLKAMGLRHCDLPNKRLYFKLVLWL
jgi:hypothetical protein